MASCCASRALPFCLPASQPTSIPSGANQLRKLLACCSASNSVGAINATCLPWAIARSAARAATSVLPEPTSPCTRRIIGTSSAISRSISATTRACAPVGLNGKAARSLFFSASLALSGWAWKRCAPARNANMLRLCASSSSRIRRRCAGCCPVSRSLSCSVGGGRCKVRNASGSVIIPCDSSGGRSSSMAQVSSRSSAWSVNLRSVACFTPSVVG